MRIFDEAWMQGYKEGVLLIKMMVMLHKEGEEELKKTYPEITEEMLEDLKNNVEEKEFLNKYENIIKEMAAYKALDEEAYQALKKYRKRKEREAKIEEVTEFLTDTEIDTNAAEPMDGSAAPIAICLSLDQIVMPASFREEMMDDETMKTKERVELAQYFLTIPDCGETEWKEELKNVIFSEKNEFFILRRGYRIVTIQGSKCCYWNILYMSKQRPWMRRWNGNSEVLKIVQIDEYGQVM